MKNFDENELIDKAVAGRLNTEEQRLWDALLAERPELEAELEIGRALRAIPKPPAISSNFTSLVLQEINNVAPERATPSWAEWFRWPRTVRWAGVAVVAIGVAIGVTHQRKEQQVAESVESFAGGLRVVGAAQPDVKPEAMVTLFQDFEAIRKLPSGGNDVDYGLLAALNE